MIKNFTRDQRNHYIFTPKMLSRLIEGLQFYPENFFQQVNMFGCNNCGAYIYKFRQYFRDQITLFVHFRHFTMR